MSGLFAISTYLSSYTFGCLDMWYSTIPACSYNSWGVRRWIWDLNLSIWRTNSAWLLFAILNLNDSDWLLYRKVKGTCNEQFYKRQKILRYCNYVIVLTHSCYVMVDRSNAFCRLFELHFICTFFLHTGKFLLSVRFFFFTTSRFVFLDFIFIFLLFFFFQSLYCVWINLKSVIKPSFIPHLSTHAFKSDHSNPIITDKPHLMISRILRVVRSACLSRRTINLFWTYLFFSFYVQFFCATENVNLLKFIFFFFRFFTFRNQTTPTSKWRASLTWSWHTEK